MSAEEKRLSTVLFVDDDPQFLEMIERVLGMWSKEEWQILTAQNTGKALFLLQERPVDLVAVDVQMPVVDGIQFLNLLNRKYPNLPQVALTGYADEHTRAAALEAGAEMCLEKPGDVDGMQSVFATLRELLRHTPETGFRGVLRRVGLTDVIQMECLGRNSSVLEISGASLRGSICIREGSIIHAQVGDRKGEAAFNKLMTLTGGEFSLKPFTEPPEESISGSWEFLLMEASRMHDEQQERSNKSIPASKPRPLRPSTSTQTTSFASVTSFMGSQSSSFSPRIDEFLICSNQGEVLCEWQCDDISGRIGFLEFLTQKSRQLAGGLQLGAFDRLEIEGQKTRVVAQLTGTYGMFLSATRGARF
jgi:CheY-like chemotaxis protein